VLALLAIVAAPAASVAVVVVNQYRDLPAGAGGPDRIGVLTHQVAAASSWEDPAWQRGLDRAAAVAQVDVMIVGTDGRPMYHSPGWPPGPGPAAVPARTPLPRPVAPGIPPAPAPVIVPAAPPVPVSNAGGESGFLYVRDRAAPSSARDRFLQVAWGLGAGLAALLVVVGLVLWATRVHVLVPLARLVEAARQIEGGDLDVSLPRARIREIDQVSSAFAGMSAALREATSRQAELERQRRFVISAVAHDLRTPLFSLRGCLEALETGLARTPEAAGRYVRTCSEKADVLERRIGELFLFARLEYLELPPRREPVDLERLVEGAVADLEPRSRARGVRFHVEGDGDRVRLDGDAGLLSRAIENLLDNAVSHARPDGHVSVRWGRAEGEAFVSVADDGPGIDPEDLPHVFEPLYRADPSRNRQTGGSGLGLAIARRAVAAHGGRLDARNGDGRGAEFTIRLPATPVSELAPSPAEGEIDFR
jgi:signal transduction histidine kinase